MFKKFAAISLVLLSQLTHADELSSYAAIEESLTQGKMITIVFKYTQCEMDNPNSFSFPIGTAVYKPQAVLISDEGYLGAKGTWFTSKILNGHENGFNQHYSLIINKQNQLKATYEFFYADSGKRSDIKNVTFKCDLGKGFRVYN